MGIREFLNLLAGKLFVETEVISEGRIIKEYNLREVMPINYLPDLLFYQTTFLLPIERKGYEVDVAGQLYELVTVEECQLPVGATIKIRTTSRKFSSDKLQFLSCLLFQLSKKSSLIYENEEFPIIAYSSKPALERRVS
jgi:hypothetical protein